VDKQRSGVCRIVARALPPALLILVASIFGAHGIAVASGDGDIICTRTKARFLLPEECLSSHCGQGLKIGVCQLDPQSRGLARAAEVHADKAGVLAQLYDNNVLRYDNKLLRNPALGSMAVAAACEFVEKLFTPYHCKTDFAVKIESEPTEFYVAFVCGAMQRESTANALNFNTDVFKMSPASLARALGHEMVHADQCKRGETYGKTGMSESRLRVAFQELEAYSWETAEDSFPRTFKVAATDLSATTPQEKQELLVDFQCADWTVKDDLRQVIVRNGGVPPELRNYVTSDPWIKSVWLPNNPDWGHQQSPGSMPQACNGSRMGL
jgi:hypothetical protein